MSTTIPSSTNSSEDVSSAIAFLGESALSQACDLLIAQSKDLYDDGCCASPSTTTSSTTNDVVDKDTTTSQQQQQHVKQMTLLYEKVHNAHNIIIQAEEAGILHNNNSSNMNRNRSDSVTNPSPNNNAHRHNSISIPAGVIPPLNRSNTTATATATPSLLVRSRGNSFASSSGGGRSSNNKNHSEVAAVGGSGIVVGSSSSPAGSISKQNQTFPSRGTSNRKSIQQLQDSGGGGSLKRSLSDISEGKGGSGSNNKKGQPPPEVLNFLKALNSSKSLGGDSSDGKKKVDSDTVAGERGNGDSDDIDMLIWGVPKKGEGETNVSAEDDMGGRGSYKCGRCGVPKKGHVCPHQATTVTLATASSISNATTPKKRSPPPPPSNPPSKRGKKSDVAISSSATTATPNEKPAVTTSSYFRSSGRSKRSTPSSAETKKFDVGQSVYVQMNNKHYSAIVKDVEEEGQVEVEFSDGEIHDVNVSDIFENDDEW